MKTCKPLPIPLSPNVFALLNKHIYTDNPLGCWNWRGRKRRDKNGKLGYGQIVIHKASFKVSRLLYYIVYGEDPANLVIRHTCDNPSCVNPYHLIAGTQRQNLQDAVIRNRTAAGSRCPRSKLTEDIVKEIRKKSETWTESRSKLAISYGIDYNTLKDLLLRKTWKHI